MQSSFIVNYYFSFLFNAMRVRIYQIERQLFLSKFRFLYLYESDDIIRLLLHAWCATSSISM